MISIEEFAKKYQGITLSSVQVQMLQAMEDKKFKDIGFFGRQAGRHTLRKLLIDYKYMVDQTDKH